MTLTMSHHLTRRILGVTWTQWCVFTWTLPQPVPTTCTTSDGQQCAQRPCLGGPGDVTDAATKAALSVAQWSSPTCLPQMGVAHQEMLELNQRVSMGVVTKPNSMSDPSYCCHNATQHVWGQEDENPVCSLLHVWGIAQVWAKNKTNAVLSICPCFPPSWSNWLVLRGPWVTQIRKGWLTPAACPQNEGGNDGR